MDKFTARENMQHFRDRLKTETDPTVRSRLHRLLIEEEDKLGYNYEAIREIDSHIAHAKAHMNRQHALVASMERDGHDTKQALVLLSAYSEVLLLFQSQREKISIKLQQSRL